MQYILSGGWYLMFVILPIFCWFGIFLFLDRKEIEPKKNISKLILLSALAILVALIVEEIFDSILFSEKDLATLMVTNLVEKRVWLLLLGSSFLSGPIEELVKYLILKWGIYKKKSFNQVIDGVIYGVTLATGFALVENTGYFIYYFLGAELTRSIFFMMFFRGIVVSSLHVAATGIMGLFMGRAKFSAKNKRKYLLKGILVASLLHGIFNASIYFKGGLMINTWLIGGAMVYLIYQTKKSSNQIIYKN